MADYGTLEDSSESPEAQELLSSASFEIVTPAEEVKMITKFSVPLIVTLLLQYSLTMVSIFVVGRIGSKELAAVSLASMTFNVTSSVFNGMSTCLDTFCPQAYGAGNHKMVGVYFQRCVAMIFTVNVPLVLIWWHSGLIFDLIVTDSELSVLAQSFLRVMAFATPAYILFETLKRFLQAQYIFSAGQYSLFVAAPLNIVLNYVFVHTFNFGFIGAPLATTVSYWIMFGVLLWYTMWFTDSKKCWPGLDIKESFKNWGHMARLALNGTVMLLSEFVAFEVMTLASARFGTETLAAQSICSTLATLTFQVPFAASMAASSRIANLIGQGNKNGAIICSKTSYWMSLVLSVANCLLLVAFRKPIAQLFSKDPKVYNMAASVLAILGVNQLYDCPNVMGAGILRSQGRQYVGSRLNFFAYYIFGLPLSFLFAFHFQLGVEGLWMGIGFGVLFLAAAEFWFVMRSPWDEVIKEAGKRNSV